MRGVCMAQQRHMVWRILRAMPLRLLERVMPWVAGEPFQAAHSSDFFLHTPEWLPCLLERGLPWVAGEPRWGCAVHVGL